MTNKIQKQYFDWLREFVNNNSHVASEYYFFLLEYLYKIEFTYLLDLDGNRANDGINLRYRFGYENGYSDHMIEECFTDKPCSVLEMLIALSIACEEHIMHDADIGDRTDKWFWIMIDNLKLKEMTDIRFDEMYADQVISRFLNREYTRFGEGGLFVVNQPREDMRITDIWYQMMWYLNEKYIFSI